MSTETSLFVGVDVGGELISVALWSAEPEQPLDALPAGWPVRVPYMDVFTMPAAADPIAQLERAICTVADRRGHALRESLLVSFGEAGSRACTLAGGLGMRGAIVPAVSCVLLPSGASPAVGIRDYTRSTADRRPLDPTLAQERFVEMMEQAAEDVQLLGLEQDDALLERFADMRYHGRPDEVSVPVGSLNQATTPLQSFHETITPLQSFDDATTPVQSFSEATTPLQTFHAIHAALHGYADQNRPVETLRLRTRCVIASLTPLMSGPAPTLPAGWSARVLSNGHLLAAPHHHPHPPGG